MPSPTEAIARTGYVILDGHEIPIKEFAKQIGLKSQYGSLYLQGYAHPLPASLTSVGGSLDLRGYAHPLPDWIISAGADRRGYWFAAVLQSGEWRVRAGYRDFSIETALSHWGSGGQSDKPDCLALVENIVAEIKVRSVEEAV